VLVAIHSCQECRRAQVTCLRFSWEFFRLSAVPQREIDATSREPRCRRRGLVATRSLARVSRPPVGRNSPWSLVRSFRASEDIQFILIDGTLRIRLVGRGGVDPHCRPRHHFGHAKPLRGVGFVVIGLSCHLFSPREMNLSGTVSHAEPEN